MTNVSELHFAIMCLFMLGKLVVIYTAVEFSAVEGMWLEEAHYPPRKWPSQYVNGTKIPDPWSDSPDFRMEESEIRVWKETFFKEENRPYRLSPFYKQYYRWSKAWYRSTKEHIYPLGCYCTTVFKKYTPLAGCAVVTTRHILTTASSTELVLKRFRKEKTLGAILGAWYDTNADTFNSSLYMVPSRIHYHPRFSYPHHVNLTHPLPFLYDLSVWAALHTFLGGIFSTVHVITCSRGGPHSWQIWSSTPRRGEMANIVGFQYIKAQRKIAMPWFKYVVRTREHYQVCPKSEWHWYHCLKGNAWSRYGVESGAAWHRQIEGYYWLYDGLIGLCAFSMHLRSETLVHYFTVLNTHSVLTFMYDAYMGRLPYEFLDDRFWDTRWGAPVAKPWAKIYHNFDFGYDHYYELNPLPWY